MSSQEVDLSIIENPVRVNKYITDMNNAKLAPTYCLPSSFSYHWQCPVPDGSEDDAKKWVSEN